MNKIHVAQSSLSLLKEIPGVPETLFVDGDLTALSRPTIAIVGTRKPSVYGLRAAYSFAKELAAQGFCIVSGLARGVDAAAHEGALATGTTVAVLGHGLDRVYPREHYQLSRAILEKGGCLISEYPPETPPFPHHFPARNRILSGLCVGTIVIEAAVKSGSLITARFAAEQGREVFVVPGRFDEESFLGGHELIQQGAKLVTNVDDVICELSHLLSPDLLIKSEHPADGSSALRRVFLDEPERALTLEELFSKSNMDLSQLFEALSRAQILGSVREIFPQQYIWSGPQYEKDENS